jgi:hypothetical protein
MTASFERAVSAKSSANARLRKNASVCRLQETSIRQSDYRIRAAWRRRDRHRAAQHLFDVSYYRWSAQREPAQKSLRKINDGRAVTSTTARHSLAGVGEHERIEQPIAVRREQTVLHRQNSLPPIGGSLFTFRYCCGIFHFPPRPYARSFPGVRSDHLMKSHGTAAAIWSEIC